MATRRTVETVESHEPVEAVGYTSGSRLGARLAEVVYTLSSLLVLLILTRLVLLLVGANAANGFVHFVYTTSYPFVAPFFGILNQSFVYGAQGLELASLIAIAVIAIAGWGIARLVSIL